mgnify:CR=1 FL=1
MAAAPMPSATPFATAPAVAPAPMIDTEWDDRSPAITQLRDVGEMLVDIHGQHAHQSLMKADAQRMLLDAHAGLQEDAKAVASAYKSWRAMKTRCSNPNTAAYKNYGERGIFYCQEWENFENFYADMGDRPEAMTLERVDNSLPYSKDNCKWATTAEQNRNTRQNIFLEKDGKRMCLTDWAKELNIPYSTLQSRVRRGWSLDLCPDHLSVLQ